MSDQSGWPAHLRDDAPEAVCSRCGRYSVAEENFGQEDRMTQPDGNPCGGRFSDPRAEGMGDELRHSHAAGTGHAHDRGDEPHTHTGTRKGDDIEWVTLWDDGTEESRMLGERRAEGTTDR